MTSQSMLYCFIESVYFLALTPILPNFGRSVLRLQNRTKPSARAGEKGLDDRHVRLSS